MRCAIFAVATAISFSVQAATPQPSASPVRAPLKYPIDTRLEGPQSQYTELLLKQLKSWPPKDIAYDSKDGNPVQLQCIETPGVRFYIGLDQGMRIHAALERVAQVLNDFAHYRELFPDFDDVHLVSRDGNRAVVFWEQHIPVFFIKNVKYELVYLIDDSHPDRVVYRYQVRKAGKIRKNDGIIVLERDGANTRYTEYDFDDADWGPLTTFAPERIWKDSVEGIYLSDVAIKLKAENPDWSYDRIRQESRKLLEKYPVDEVLKHRRRFNP